ncbi:MAG: precorrin-4 C(11)-methyltransferase [Cyanobacteria bacterium J06559_1]
MDLVPSSKTAASTDSPVIAHILSPAVYIVGAGPGDPELLTVKAQRLIQQADVLVYANSLVPAQILAGTRPDAEKIATANMTLEDIVPLMIERVKAGKSVVRLHSGDPSLYSAIHEQMMRLADAEVPFEVIPGISAFQAAAATLQAELTIPAVVQSIVLTRISGRTQVPVAEELASLAAHKTSLCLYLSARHIQTAQAQLLHHYQPHTPVAICFRVGWPDEQITVVPLSKMAEISESEALVRTTMYIISPALESRGGRRFDYVQSGYMQAEDKVHTDETEGIKTDAKAVRSRLYSPTHDHLFRPSKSKPHKAQPRQASQEQLKQQQLEKQQEHGRT